MGKYRLSLRSYCRIHSMEIAIDRAESEGRLEALFNQVYGEHTAWFVEELFGKQAKKSLMKNDAVDFSEAYSLLKTLKEDGIIELDQGEEIDGFIELDHGEEMHIGQIPDNAHHPPQAVPLPMKGKAELRARPGGPRKRQTGSMEKGARAAEGENARSNEGREKHAGGSSED